MTERVGVLIKNGVVENAIVWADDSAAQYDAEGWDVAMEVTDLPSRPGIGWTYSESDGFRPPQLYPSWSWSESGLEWVPPVTQPQAEGKHYEWNEATQDWEPYTATQDPTTGHWTITKD